MSIFAITAAAAACVALVTYGAWLLDRWAARRWQARQHAYEARLQERLERAAEDWEYGELRRVAAMPYDRTRGLRLADEQAMTRAIADADHYDLQREK